MEATGSVTRSAQRRALRLALAANALYMGAEIAGGIAFDSLALLADAGHMLSDVAALAIALVALRLVERPASARHTYGLQRAEVLGALVNGVILLAVAAGVVIEALRRLDDPADVAGGGLVAVASLGLVVNLASARLIAASKGQSLNMQGAFTHMLADAAGSAGAIVAGLLVLFAGADRADPLMSLAIAALVLWSAYRLVRDTVHVLLEGTPRGMDPSDVERAMSATRGVESVHHLHLWNLASDVPALSAHVVLRGEVSLHEAQLQGDGLKQMLLERFGIEHATLDLECHDCEP